jgi:hypothetical protein
LSGGDSPLANVASRLANIASRLANIASRLTNIASRLTKSKSLELFLYYQPTHVATALGGRNKQFITK